MNNQSYKNGLKDELKDKDTSLKNKNKLLTYTSLATEPDSFKNVVNDTKPELLSFFFDLFETYKPVMGKIIKDKLDKKNTPDEKFGSKRRKKYKKEKQIQENIRTDRYCNISFNSAFCRFGY